MSDTTEPTEPTATMLVAGVCRICETGPLGLRLCGGCGRVVLLCDECDAVWTNARIDEPPAFPADPELPCPHCAAPLNEAPSRWANSSDCAGEAWISEAVDAGRIELRRGEPLE